MKWYTDDQLYTIIFILYYFCRLLSSVFTCEGVSNQ